MISRELIPLPKSADIEGYLRYKDLKGRGWIAKTVAEHLGEPDLIRPFGNDGQIIRYYRADRIAEATLKGASPTIIRERTVGTKGFLPIHALLDDYERMLEEDGTACLGQPDEDGDRMTDEDKYIALCCDNPRIDEYVRIWEDVKKRMVAVWNSMEESQRDPYDLSYLIDRIEGISEDCHAPYNVITTNYINACGENKELRDLLFAPQVVSEK